MRHACSGPTFKLPKEARGSDVQVGNRIYEPMYPMHPMQLRVGALCKLNVPNNPLFVFTFARHLFSL